MTEHRLRCKTNILLLVAMAASLYGADATADEERGMYAGFGIENDPTAPSGPFVGMRRAQRNGVPLQYLEPIEDRMEQESAFTIMVGAELTDWLDAELSWHDIWSEVHANSNVPAFDPTLPAAAQEMEAHHYTNYTSAIYSLSLLPRWKVNKYVSVYARAGLGYATIELDSVLASSGVVAYETACQANGCRIERRFVRRDWNVIERNQDAFIPIWGIGIQVAPFLRIEYNRRMDMPVGDTTIDWRSNVYVSFRVRTAWMAE